MWDFLKAVKGPNVIKGIDGRWETTVETEDLAIHQRRQW